MNENDDSETKDISADQDVIDFKHDFGRITKVVAIAEPIYATHPVFTPGGVWCGTIAT